MSWGFRPALPLTGVLTQGGYVLLSFWNPFSYGCGDWSLPVVDVPMIVSKVYCNPFTVDTAVMNVI